MNSCDGYVQGVNACLVGQRDAVQQKVGKLIGFVRHVEHWQAGETIKSFRDRFWIAEAAFGNHRFRHVQLVRGSMLFPPISGKLLVGGNN